MAQASNDGGEKRGEKPNWAMRGWWVWMSLTGILIVVFLVGAIRDLTASHEPDPRVIERARQEGYALGLDHGRGRPRETLEAGRYIKAGQAKVGDTKYLLVVAEGKDEDPTFVALRDPDQLQSSGEKIRVRHFRLDQSVVFADKSLQSVKPPAKTAKPKKR